MVDEAASLGRTLYVVRHAEREDNVNNQWFQRYPGYQTDNTPLSDRGRSQAEDLRGFFKDIPIHAIYASPYDRTMETASILSHDHDLSINVEPGLAEILYLCENSPGFWPNDRLKTKFPRVHLDYDPVFNVPLPEEGYDCTPRLTKTIEGIVDKHRDSDNIVVVSHQSSIDSIFMGLGCDSAYVGQATISIFQEIEPQSSQFRCTRKAHKDHLSKENKKNLRGC